MSRPYSAFGGYVYVLTNESMPGIVKIGKTSREDDDRLRELFTTGVPTPFELAFQIRTLDMALLEFAAHKEFAEQRVSKNREFFKVDPNVVADLLRDINQRITMDIIETLLPEYELVKRHDSIEDEEAALEARLAEIRARKKAAA